MGAKRKTSSSSSRKTGRGSDKVARAKTAAREFAEEARETGAGVLGGLGTLDSVLASLFTSTASALDDDSRVMTVAAQRMRDAGDQPPREEPAEAETAGDEAVATLAGDPQALERLLLERFEVATQEERSAMFRRVVQEILFLRSKSDQGPHEKPGNDSAGTKSTKAPASPRQSRSRQSRSSQATRSSNSRGRKS